MVDVPDVAWIVTWFMLWLIGCLTGGDNLQGVFDINALVRAVVLANSDRLLDLTPHEHRECLNLDMVGILGDPLCRIKPLGGTPPYAVRKCLTPGQNAHDIRHRVGVPGPKGGGGGIIWDGRVQAAGPATVLGLLERA